MKTNQIILAVVLLALASSWLYKTQFKNSMTSQCKTLQAQLTQQLNVDFNYKIKSQAQACVLTGTATGTQVEIAGKSNYQLTLNKLIKVLQANNWRETPATKAYAADGVYSTQLALAQNRQYLAVIQFNVQGKDESRCPKDQPTDIYKNCQLQPEQRIYSLRIKLTVNK